MPSYDMVSNKLLVEMYDKVKEKISKEVDSFDVCSITTDGWTSRQCFGYISLTIHYVSQAYKTITRTLSIKNITGSQTGEAIKSKLIQILNDWKITNKAECVTTDNGK